MAVKGDAISEATEVHFRLNGEERRIIAPKPTKTLLEWLREDAACVGVKEGCAEGDCGACTVLACEDGRLRPLNSCILFLPMADGLDLLTVEGLAPAKGAELHPAQAAMVDLHGSQCGFCTPGFVMALAAWASDDQAQSDDDLRAALAGNLCRCTGYGPILDAGRVIKQSAPVANSTKKLEPKPTTRKTALGYRSEDCGAYFAPTQLSNLLDTLAANPGATMVGGATDVGLWITKQDRELPVLIATRDVVELQTIEETKYALILGGAVTYVAAQAALTRLHPALAPYIRRIGGPQVRESGTIGGNIANGSPIGDMPPVLIALGAEIELASKRGARPVALEDFYIEYGKQDRAPDEVLTRIIIPRPAEGEVLAAEKLSKRIEQDISAVAMGLKLQLKDGHIANACLAFGGMAGIPRRASKAEAALTGQAFTMSAFERAAAALAEDFSPLSDHRASAHYRMLGAQGLLRRAFLRLTGDPQAPDIDALMAGGGHG